MLPRLLTAAFICLLLLFHAAEAPVRGAGFEVTTTEDAPDSAAGDGVCAAAGGGCSLRAAVMEASALDGPDSISLPAGVYSLTLTGSGPLVINGGLAISGAGQYASVIDGSGVAAAGLGVFNIPYDPARPPVVFSGLTLRKGATPEYGGAVVARSALTLDHVKIERNTSASGGGVYNSGILSVFDSTISGNSAYLGGAIFNDIGGVLTLERSTLSSNLAYTSGGGLDNHGAATVRNSTVSGNSGGGLTGDQGTISLLNSTVVHNIAPVGGAAGLAGAGFSIKNTIVAQNSGGPECAISGQSLGHNLDDDASCPFGAAGDLSGESWLRLGPLADNGGPTLTHALLPSECAGSACLPASAGIDAGDNDGCPASDQRGQPRPVDGDGDGIAQCDVGAYERCAAVPADYDCDGLPDASDNCPTVYNASQADANGDLKGDACEALGSGNVDCDGAISSADALKLLRGVVRLAVYQSEPCADIGLMLSTGRRMGDVNCNGAISSADALAVLRYAVLLPVGLPSGCPPIGPP